MSIEIIEWKNPPRNWGNDLDDLADKLKKRPFAWAVVATNLTNYQTIRWANELRDRGIETRNEPLNGATRSPNAHYELYARSNEG